MKVSDVIRYMKTTQERRQYYADKDEAHVRASRNATNIPSAYDDLWRCIQRTWKVHRKTKYKIKDD